MFKSLAISALFLTFASVSAAAQEVNGCVDISSNGDGSLVDRDFVPTGTPLLSRFGFASRTKTTTYYIYSSTLDFLLAR